MWCVCRAGHPKIADYCKTTGGDKDIVKLKVHVYHSLLVQTKKPSCNVGSIGNSLKKVWIRQVFQSMMEWRLAQLHQESSAWYAVINRFAGCKAQCSTNIYWVAKTGLQSILFRQIPDGMHRILLTPNGFHCTSDGVGCGCLIDLPIGAFPNLLFNFHFCVYPHDLDAFQIRLLHLLFIFGNFFLYFGIDNLLVQLPCHRIHFCSLLGPVIPKFADLFAAIPEVEACGALALMIYCKRDFGSVIGTMGVPGYQYLTFWNDCSVSNGSEKNIIMVGGRWHHSPRVLVRVTISHMSHMTYDMWHMNQS